MATAIDLRRRIDERKKPAVAGGVVCCQTEHGEWAVAKAVKVKDGRCREADAMVVCDSADEARETLVDVNKSIVGKQYLKRSGGDVLKALGKFMRDIAIRKASLNTISGIQGGYLVPEELLVTTDNILSEDSIFHRFAKNTRMQSSTQYIPAYDIAASHVDGTTPLYGGLTLSWSAENTTLPDTKPSFERSELVAKNLYSLITASDQLVADGGLPFGLFMNDMIANAICWAVERACFRGIVANQPQGIVDAPASVVHNRASGNDVTNADLANMVSKLLPACYRKAIWCFHPTTAAKIGALAQYQISESTDGRPIGIIHGIPAYPTEKLPKLGTKGDVVLFDPTQYVLGRRHVEVVWAPSINTSLVTKQQTLIRVIWRGDGQFMARGTATLENNTSVCGVSVVLN